MNPQERHREAMRLAGEARVLESRGMSGIDKLKEAAAIESGVADFYIDRHDLEPTRSIIIESAAWLNAKAGNTEAANRYFEILNLPTI